MKLSELNPKFTAEDISFDCPICKQHRITVPIIGKHGWTMHDKSFKEMTLTPSIAHDNGIGCKSHFYITKGEIQIL